MKENFFLCDVINKNKLVKAEKYKGHKLAVLLDSNENYDLYINGWLVYQLKSCEKCLELGRSLIDAPSKSIH